MQHDVLDLAYQLSNATQQKIADINAIMQRTRILSLNARLEASRAGASGAAFSVVAQEIGQVADQVRDLATKLQQSIDASSMRIEGAGQKMLVDFRGQRFADLARNVVEIIDRNLYERSCDVRWWATDSAVIQVVEAPSSETASWANSRLATILRSYTVYLDLWVADRNGKIVSNGRRDRYPHIIGTDVSQQEWFTEALRTRNGDQFAVCDITRNPYLGNAQVATYSTAIRQNGDVSGSPIGALGIFFDWEPQSQSIVSGVALSEDEKADARVMLLNAKHEVIASSDGIGVLTETFPLKKTNDAIGFYCTNSRLISYSETPGYETYRGLGWYGCIAADLGLSR